MGQIYQKFRRSFSLKVVEMDAFLEMPPSSRLLYYDLGMRADDEGFVYPQKVIRMTGANADDLKVLIAKKFVHQFGDGVLVVLHWWANNFVRADRVIPSDHRAKLRELKKLGLDYMLPEPKSLSVNCQADDRQVSGKCQPSDNPYKDKDNNNNNDRGKEPARRRGDDLPEFVAYFNEKRGRSFKITFGLKEPYAYWRQFYTLDEMKRAVDRMDRAKWDGLKNGTVELLLRRKNRQGEPVDYIGELLNGERKVRAVEVREI